jgi:ectoine hydroxylase-related dioxygenase (phytanoyl-CoA dioxygenase family)
MSGTVREKYDRDGYLSPIRIITASAANQHRAALEKAEAKIGPLHYLFKAHTILQSPMALATNPVILDVVEQLLGPNILLYNATYIIKESHTPSHVSWHQDLTYWGLSADDQVSIWLALSPATPVNGCMRMIPGSHTKGAFDHHKTTDQTNVLNLGQTVHGVDEAQSRLCPLESGEASFHHGWTLHASGPNDSDDRRIGLNFQYFKTDMRQIHYDKDTAMLVRGVDEYHYFRHDIPATSNLDPVAVQRRDGLDALIKSTYQKS